MITQLTDQDEVNSLSGKFIIQLNTEDKNFNLTDSNWEFYKEKRISFVSGLKLIGFYYTHCTFDTHEEFIEYFNNYIGTSKGKRYHRLLTSKELEFVFQKMKETQW